MKLLRTWRVSSAGSVVFVTAWVSLRVPWQLCNTVYMLVLYVMYVAGCIVYVLYIDCDPIGVREKKKREKEETAPQ